MRQFSDKILFNISNCRILELILRYNRYRIILRIRFNNTNSHAPSGIYLLVQSHLLRFTALACTHVHTLAFILLKRVCTCTATYRYHSVSTHSICHLSRNGSTSLLSVPNWGTGILRIYDTCVRNAPGCRWTRKRGCKKNALFHIHARLIRKNIRVILKLVFDWITFAFLKWMLHLFCESIAEYWNLFNWMCTFFNIIISLIFFYILFFSNDSHIH